ncbi:MAG: hypothetical protein HOP16_21540 [Acidobacteria bacterium]|nr:hypothetical protein [Acidobacteriota bacterium]
MRQRSRGSLRVSIDYRTLDDVVEGFAGLEQGFRARHDRRSMFLTLYGVVSAEMGERIASGAFADPAWVQRYAVAFANLYRVALEAYDAGRVAQVPRAWRLCFDAARAGTCTVLQDVLLGVNAHVNNDLAFALDRVTVGPDRESRRHDHNAVNNVLSGVTERATRQLASLYAPGIATMDEVAGDFDEVVSRASLGGARDAAWESACALADARGPVERGLAAARVSTRAAVLARLLLAPLRRPDLVAVCRRLEEEANWLTLLDRLKTP